MPVDIGHRRTDLREIVVRQQGGDVGVDGELYPFGTFFPVAQPPYGRPFADAGCAVRVTDTDDDDRLGVHRHHGQGMGSDGRKVDDQGLDRTQFDAVCHSDFLGVPLRWGMLFRSMVAKD